MSAAPGFAHDKPCKGNYTAFGLVTGDPRDVNGNGAACYREHKGELIVVDDHAHAV